MLAGAGGHQRHRRDGEDEAHARVHDAHPGHEFAGFIEMQPDPGLDGDPCPTRYIVDGRTVRTVRARLAWPDEADPALTEARDLAKLMIRIMESLPTSLCDYDDSLAYENLPEWAGGEAETWQREDEDGA